MGPSMVNTRVDAGSNMGSSMGGHRGDNPTHSNDHSDDYPTLNSHRGDSLNSGLNRVDSVNVNSQMGSISTLGFRKLVCYLIYVFLSFII